MFLSRLNEISGGCEKIVPVSESFWSNLKFLRMIDSKNIGNFLVIEGDSNYNLKLAALS